MNRYGRIFASALVAVATGIISVPAAADRDDHRRDRHDRDHGPGRGHDRDNDRHRQPSYHHHHRGPDRPVIIYQSRPMYVVRGAPDWAPAYYYRRPRENYVVPYGLAQGRCDRSEMGQMIGAVAGGVAGGLLGNQVGGGSGRTAATIGGAVAGVLVGGSIGRSMDRIDQSCVGHSLEYAPTGRPVAWRNPDHGADYQVIPRQTYEDRAGRFCREYSTEVLIGGRRQEAYGTACRQPDGAWEVIS